jgi:hypothetical protein
MYNIKYLESAWERGSAHSPATWAPLRPGLAFLAAHVGDRPLVQLQIADCGLSRRHSYAIERLLKAEQVAELH